MTKQLIGKHGIFNIEKNIPHETNVYRKTALMMQSGDSVYFDNDKDATKLAEMLWRCHRQVGEYQTKTDVVKTKKEGTGRRVWLL
jgi:hypothetical protein